MRWDELPEFAEGLVALTGDEEGPLSAKLQASKLQTPGKLQNPAQIPQDSAAGLHKLSKSSAGKTVFIEIQRHHLRGEEREQQRADRISPSTFHLPLLATNGVLYATAYERPVLDVFTCIRNHTHLDAAGHIARAEQRTPSEKRRRNASLVPRFCPEAINNTARLAERLQFTLENLGYEFPRFQSAGAHDGFVSARAKRLRARGTVIMAKIPEKVAIATRTRTRSDSKARRSPVIF